MDLTVEKGRTALCESAFSPGSHIMKRYVVHQKLGSGSFATTYLVTDLKDRESQKAIKRIPCNTVREDATLPSAREAKLLGNLRHPFIVQFFGSFLERKDFCIVLEYCEGGDLHGYIQQQKDKSENFTEEHVMEWFIQLLLGVNYLHERLVMHRDLKTKNIFLKDGILKIGDFGVSRILAPSDMATTITGTASYMSPEVFSNKGYNAKSDIWSLGCILYEMCSFTRAFDCPRWIKLVSMIVNDPSPILSSKYSAALNDILQRMLMKDPELRPSAKEILQFPYVIHRGQVLSQWLQEVIGQDRRDAVDKDITRIANAMQEKLHLDSLQAMRIVQEMAPRQRRRIRQEEDPETHISKLKKAVERVYEENCQRVKQNWTYHESEDVYWMADRTSDETEVCSEEEDSKGMETIDGSILTISLPLSEQQSSTLRAYQSCLQRFLDSSSDTAEIEDSVPWDSEDTIVSVCSEQEITRLRQDCVQLLGEDAFLEVYNYWKQVYNQQDPEQVDGRQEPEDKTLCEPQVMKLYPQHCYKVQQLLFLEQRIEVESPLSFTWL
ncbi:serine/threonine-protein kinase Nek11-like [Leptodactylus fuscus]|uniref:serine/threonine-protein kinase Nek11-like n=1 Tax=Leptodactylus fuscus TaxID=238119 RepID=UPI003F4EF12E